jgi:rod shape-determining protein MreC
MARLSVLRETMTEVLSPIQYLANVPTTLYRFGANFFTEQNRLLQENAQLKAQQLLLQAQLQKLSYLQHDNEQLRALLDVKTRVEGRVMPAQLLSVAEGDNVEQKIVLDKGRRDGVYIGQPILDAYGVIGQIVSLVPFNSTALLITDAKSAIPVIDVRNGLRAIAAGFGDSEFIELINLPQTADVQVGDLFVTSGVGFQLPEGYPVGVVKSIATDKSARFVKVIVKPRAAINSSKYVLLVWSEKFVKTNSAKTNHINNGTKSKKRKGL